MTAYNPHMTLHKLFLNIKKRDVYAFLRELFQDCPCACICVGK